VCVDQHRYKRWKLCKLYQLLLLLFHDYLTHWTGKGRGKWIKLFNSLNPEFLTLFLVSEYGIVFDVCIWDLPLQLTWCYTNAEVDCVCQFTNGCWRLRRWKCVERESKEVKNQHETLINKVGVLRSAGNLHFESEESLPVRDIVCVIVFKHAAWIFGQSCQVIKRGAIKGLNHDWDQCVCLIKLALICPKMAHTFGKVLESWPGIKFHRHIFHAQFRTQWVILHIAMSMKYLSLYWHPIPLDFTVSITLWFMRIQFPCLDQTLDIGFTIHQLPQKFLNQCMMMSHVLIWDD